MAAATTFPATSHPVELSVLRRHTEDPTIEDETHNDPTRDVVIHMDNVHKTYLLGIEGVPALRGVTLSIRRGELVVIFGTSGGGKTTMLNIIGTIDKPTKGQLFLFGNRITSRTKDSELAAIRSKKMGFVFQTFNLLSSMTALENVEMPMVLLGGMSAEERTKRAVSLLQRVGMGHRLNHYPTQLSGGEQQRVTIARAIANKPELLLLDEPTGDLDTKNGHIVMKMLLELNEREGMTMVFVTHDVNLKNFAHRVVRMRDGKIASVETIAPKLRVQAKEQLLRQLGETVESVRIEESVAAEVAAAAPAAPTWSQTEIRQPRDYGYINFNTKVVHTPAGGIAGPAESVVLSAAGTAPVAYQLPTKIDVEAVPVAATTYPAMPPSLLMPVAAPSPAMPGASVSTPTVDTAAAAPSVTSSI